MKKRVGVSSLGIPVIMPSAGELARREQSKRAQARVLEKLAAKAMHFTVFSVLERTELRALEADGLIVCEGGGTWRLKSMPGPAPLPPGAGVIRCSPTFTAKKLEAMPAPTVIGAGLPASTDAAILARGQVVNVCCSWCGRTISHFGPHAVCGTCLHRELAALGPEGAPI